jgi:antitoxin component HigA of HigAB toxin-antitoxin module
MKELRTITSEEQYDAYCDELERLDYQEEQTKEVEERIEQLLALIDEWDATHYTFPRAEPVELLELLMTENELNISDLSRKVGIKEDALSSILGYEKAISEKEAALLSNCFKLSKEAFNRPYPLKK